MLKVIITRATTPVTRISWSADWQALSFRFCPRYWEATTAPPVATAAKILMISTLIMSTKETPEVAASPALDTIIVSTIPTETASICSMINGKISFFRSFPEKRVPTVFAFPTVFSFCIIIFPALLSFHFPGYQTGVLCCNDSSVHSCIPLKIPHWLPLYLNRLQRSPVPGHLQRLPP